MFFEHYLVVIIVIFDNLYFTRQSIPPCLNCVVRSRGGIFIATTFLQILHRMRWWKKFLNRSIFRKNIDKNLRL